MFTYETISRRVFAAASSLAISAFVFAVAIMPATPSATHAGMMI